jgi:hypothetical protein
MTAKPPTIKKEVLSKYDDIHIARMRVPKLVKNGFDSFLRASKCSRRPVTARKSMGNGRLKTDDQNGNGE